MNSFGEGSRGMLARDTARNVEVQLVNDGRNSVLWGLFRVRGCFWFDVLFGEDLRHVWFEVKFWFTAN